MKLERLPYHQGDLADFYEEGLTALGGLCSRTWHDRVEVLAEGSLTQLWKEARDLRHCELSFVAPGVQGARSAETEVFPGCPITFKLCEQLMRARQAVPSVVVSPSGLVQPPSLETAEKLWRTQHGEGKQWSLASPFQKTWHFSLVLSVRFEIQAIDQQWALHRVGVSLSDGYADELLARDLGRLDLPVPAVGPIPWPSLTVPGLEGKVAKVLESELGTTLEEVRRRQSLHLQRELARIDAYFGNYSKELRSRKTRGGTVKSEERLLAAQKEHERHRLDQVARHEIAVYPHIDTALLVAEPAYAARVRVRQGQEVREVAASYVVRSRRWSVPQG